ncbi:MAG: hypothetical protein H6Q67_1689 [Firmicutes bacterium]|nr:hypothetical protein [Bacillota bacterium]
MVEKIVSFCKVLVAKFISSSKRFPETIFLTTSIVIILCFENHMSSVLSSESLNALSRISMILGLGIPLSLSIKVFFERRPLERASIKAMIYGISIIGLWLYYIFLLEDMNSISMIRYMAVNISFYCMFIFIPHFYNKENYELYIITLVSRFFVTYLYSVILYAGLAAILGTIHVLGLIVFSGKTYFDIGCIVFGIFAPTFFLGNIPKNHEELMLSCYPNVLKILLLYIIMPLLTVYTITLYIYFAKILITMQWPEGIVSNLVMWYSLLSVTVIFAIYPLRDGNHWARQFIHWFPIAILPLLAMMFASLGIRINAYGITENRYFIFLTGIWLVGCMVYLIVRKRPRTLALTISVAILSLLSVIGPWSCFSVSTASQSMRFERILSKYDILENGKIVKISKEISVDDKKEIGSIISYFNRYNKLSTLKALPENFSIGQMKTVFGFSETGRSEKYFNLSRKKQTNLVDISGFDYFVEVSVTNEMIQNSNIPISISYTEKDGEVKIMKMGQLIYEGNINDVAMRIYSNNKTNTSLQNDEMMVTDQNENVKVVYVVKRISGIEENAVISVRSAEFSLLIKLK